MLWKPAGYYGSADDLWAILPYLRGLTDIRRCCLWTDPLQHEHFPFRAQSVYFLSQSSQVERVEAVLGRERQFRQRCMGGTINLLTPAPSFAPGSGGSKIHGEFNVMGQARMLRGHPTHVCRSDAACVMAGRGNVRRLNNIRPGQGGDSRNAFYRYFGMTPDKVRYLLAHG